MAIDPSMAISGPEWTVAAPELDGAAQAAPGATNGGGFGDMLASSISSLSSAQDQSAEAVKAFAAGQDIDATTVVTAVERAQLSMQMASTMRTKAVEAYQDIFHTQV